MDEEESTIPTQKARRDIRIAVALERIADTLERLLKISEMRP